MPKTLVILEPNAIAAYKEADNKGKAMLAKLFGDKVFNQSITDRIKTFEDVLNEANITEEAFLKTCGTSPDNIAYEKLKLIMEVLNEGWVPNWNDGNEYKYWAWWDMKNGFSFDDVDRFYQLSLVGSRLCFKSSALAKYAATQFLDIYKAYFVIPE